MTSRRVRKYPLPSPRERWLMWLFLAVVGIPFCVLFWYLLGWQIGAGFAWLFR